MKTVTLPIKGLNVAGCAYELEKSLSKCEPIRQVEANYATQTATKGCRDHKTACSGVRQMHEEKIMKLRPENSTMKLRLVVVTLALLLLAVGFNLFTPSSASAQAIANDCMHATTIDSLEMCVKHAEKQGHINNQHVAYTLLAKLDRAEDALADNHAGTAIWWLKAFIREVKTQSGKHIIPMHAMHLIIHAEMVIQAIPSE